MKRSTDKDWTVQAIGVYIINGQREEKPLEDFTDSELKEIAARKNLEALRAAGYTPVQKKSKTGSLQVIDSGRIRK